MSHVEAPRAPTQTWYFAPGTYPLPWMFSLMPEGPLAGDTERVADVGIGATEVEDEALEVVVLEVVVLEVVELEGGGPSA